MVRSGFGCGNSTVYSSLSADREINGTFCYDDGFLYVGLHAPICILKINVKTGKTIQRGTGSGLTRTGMQVTDDYLLVLGVHNPGCVHASDLSRFFPIIRCRPLPLEAPA